jgi:hypothetical protein
MIEFLRIDEQIPLSFEINSIGKQEFRRTDFGSRLLAAEGEGGGVCLK